MEMATPNTDLFLRHGLVYLREVVRTLGMKGVQLASDWGDEVEDDDADCWTGIYIRPAKARTDYLWLGLAADPDEPPKIWLACIGGPDALWERLKKSVPGEIFEEVFVLEDEEAGNLDDGLFCGIELRTVFPEDVEIPTIRTAARVAAEGILKALGGDKKKAVKSAARSAAKAPALKVVKAEKPAPKKAAAKPAPKAVAKPAPKKPAKK